MFEAFGDCVFAGGLKFGICSFKIAFSKNQSQPLQPLSNNLKNIFPCAGAAGLLVKPELYQTSNSCRPRLGKLEGSRLSVSMVFGTPSNCRLCGSETIFLQTEKAAYRLFWDIVTGKPWNRNLCSMIWKHAWQGCRIEGFEA